MQTLKKIISHYMYMIICMLVIFILVMIIGVQISAEQRRAYEDATITIRQIESVLGENQEKLEEIKEEYRQTCIHNAEMVAYIIETNPEVLESVDELKDIAVSMEIDEIHIFDTTGRIFTGTHPEYYGFTFDSGEQINFLKLLQKNDYL